MINFLVILMKIMIMMRTEFSPCGDAKLTLPKPSPQFPSTRYPLWKPWHIFQHKKVVLLESRHDFLDDVSKKWIWGQMTNFCDSFCIYRDKSLQLKILGLPWWGSWWGRRCWGRKAGSPCPPSSPRGWPARKSFKTKNYHLVRWSKIEVKDHPCLLNEESLGLTWVKYRIEDLVWVPRIKVRMSLMDQGFDSVIKDRGQDQISRFRAKS